MPDDSIQKPKTKVELEAKVTTNLTPADTTSATTTTTENIITNSPSSDEVVEEANSGSGIDSTTEETNGTSGDKSTTEAGDNSDANVRENQEAGKNAEPNDEKTANHGSAGSGSENGQATPQGEANPVGEPGKKGGEEKPGDKKEGDKDPKEKKPGEEGDPTKANKVGETPADGKPIDSKPGEKKLGTEGSNPNAPKAADQPHGPKPAPSDTSPLRTPKSGTGSQGLGSKYKNFMDQYKNAANPKKFLADEAKKWAMQALRQALMVVVNALGGWWVFAGCLLIFIIILILSLGVAAVAQSGYFGKTYPAASGKKYANVKKVVEKIDQTAKTPDGKEISNFTNLKLKSVDKKFIEDGLADKRLLDILKYLTDKHSTIEISHINDGYQNMSDNPEASDQINKNVSAHKEGLAADIDTVDFIYKVDEEQEYCKQALASACGAVSMGALYEPCYDFAKKIKLGNLVFYSDENLENENDSSSNASSIDSETINNKLKSQQTILNNAKQTANQSITEANSTIPVILSSKITLVAKTNSALGDNATYTEEQKAKIQAQITKINSAMDKINNLVTKIDNFQQKIGDLNSKIISIEEKLIELNEMLQNVQSINEFFDGSSDANDSLSKMIAKISEVISKLDTISAKVTSLSIQTNTAVDTIRNNAQDLQNTINKTENDTNKYIQDIEDAATKLDTIENLDVLGTVETSLPGLDNFDNQLEDIINQAIDETIDKAKEELENKLDDAVQNGLDEVTNSMDLGTFDTNALLTLPCMGFTPEGVSSNTSNGSGISSTDNLNLGGSLSASVEVDAGWFDVDTITFTFPIMELIKKIIPEEYLVYAVIPNTKYDDKDAEAIPIRIKWQDSKPNAKYVANEDDDAAKHNPLIYYTVYQPEARRKAHQLVSECLQYPYDSGNPDYNKVTQLITFSDERDVKPFAEKLDKLYSKIRPGNFGLFSMPESWAQLHIGY